MSAEGVDDGFQQALLDDDAEELYENAPCAYLSALPDGTIAKVNRTFLAWTHYPAGDLVGKRRFQDLLAPGDRIFFETHLAPALRMQGHVREIALEVVCQPGGRLPVLVNAVLQRDERGEPRALRMAIFDATERRAYERELLAARRRAEESEARATALARTLQASFLPPEMLEIPGLDIGGAYRPAGDGSEVGGDFYDVFQTAPGTWGIVLGDVCGKGAAAASLTALARYTVRAAAMRASDPSDVLRAVHEAFARYHPEQFCTAILCMVERAEEPVRLQLAAGGHHLPLRVTADCRVGTLGKSGTLLGLVERPRLTTESVELSPGDVVVLYTDGVVDARRDHEFFGDDRTARTVMEAAAGTAQMIASAVVDAAVAFEGGATRDDMAVLVMKAAPGSAPGT